MFQCQNHKNKIVRHKFISNNYLPGLIYSSYELMKVWQMRRVLWKKNKLTLNE